MILGRLLPRRHQILTAMILTLVLSFGLAGVAIAGKFHFKSTDFSLNSPPEFSGELVGLGDQVATVWVTLNGDATAMCENNGGNQAPGRNPVAVSASASEMVVTASNGNASVEITFDDPTWDPSQPSPTPKEAGCPSQNWIVVGINPTSVDWTDAHVVVTDDAGVVQIELFFTCTTTFDSNGVATGIACVET